MFIFEVLKKKRKKFQRTMPSPTWPIRESVYRNWIFRRVYLAKKREEWGQWRGTDGVCFCLFPTRNKNKPKINKDTTRRNKKIVGIVVVVVVVRRGGRKHCTNPFRLYFLPVNSWINVISNCRLFFSCLLLFQVIVADSFPHSSLLNFDQSWRH